MSYPRLVFGVISATQSAAVVAQLAQVLAPHRVWVHHDFRKRPDFHLAERNVALVPDPKDTGWGTWGLCEAIVHTLRHALAEGGFDYFQVLSPTCLPIRPLAQFAAHVAQSPAQAHIDVIDLTAEDDALMTFGYRTFAPEGSLRLRVLRRARRWYFGEQASLVQTRSLALLRQPGARQRGWGRWASWTGLAITRAAAAGWLGPHPFRGAVRPVIGGAFFGARRRVCEYLVHAATDLQRLAFVRRLPIVDETLWASLLVQSQVALGPSNHVISPFTRTGSPRWIESDDLPDLWTSGRFFARKFVDDPGHATRQAVLRRLERADAAQGDDDDDDRG